MTENLIEVKCVHCGSWLKSPFYFGDFESFNSSGLTGNTTNCQRCNSSTPCDKEYMRFTDASGNVLYVGAKTI